MSTFTTVALPADTATEASIVIFSRETEDTVQLDKDSIDWIKWGTDPNPNVFVRKTGETKVIPNFVKLGSGELERYTDSKITWSWTDGDPTDSENDDRTGIRTVNKGTGFSFTLPADQTARTLKLYVGGWDSTAELTAALSDNSALPFTIQKTHSAGGDTSNTYAITYRAAAAGQTLTVNWQMVEGKGECTLQAVTLSKVLITASEQGYKALTRGGEVRPSAEAVPPRNAAARSLFDGKTLSGWEGNTDIWKVENGMITSGSLTEFIEHNDFLASTEDYRNFILHFKIKMVGTEGFINGGMQIRSTRVSGSQEMAGYQCDYGDPTWWGSIYDESRRNILMAQSDMKALDPVVKRDDWNEYVIRAIGPRITTWINGVQGVDFTEEDETIPQSGRLGIQIHGGGKLTVEVKDVTILELPDEAPKVEEREEKSDQGSRDAEPASRALGMIIKPFAKAPQVQSGVALTVDDLGKVYVAETYRFGHGAEDNRSHTDWIMEDLAIKTLEERRAMLTKHAAGMKPGYLTEKADRVVRLVDQDKDGMADVAGEFAGDFRDMVEGPAAGIIHGLLDGKEIYLANSPRLWKLKDTNSDGIAESREVLLEGLGIRTSFLGHDLHGLTWGPDGMLYFSLGDRGFHVTTKEGNVISNPDQGGVFRCRPDGSGLEQVYYGLRNPQEMAFNEYGDLFTVDNNADQGDEARIHWLIEGGDSGWHVGHQSLTTNKDHIDEGGFDQPPHWLSENLWKPAHEGQPLWIMPPLKNFTMGPSGMTFTSGLSLPDRYKNSFFVTDYIGTPNLCFVWSFKATWKNNSYAVEDGHLFHKGITNSDVDFGPDGKMYVLDFGGGWGPSGEGAVYTMAWPEGMARKEVASTQKLLAEGFIHRPLPELLGLLGHLDQRIRLRASVALAAMGEKVTGEVAKNTANVSGLARWHGIWTLGQLAAAPQIRPFLKDSDAETRAQAARTAGQLMDAAAAPDLRELLDDPAPRVRIFAALALGRLKDQDALPAILAMISQQGTKDAFLRHAGVMALVGTAPPEKLSTLSTHAEASVRLCAALALRKIKHQEIGRFLADGDEAIAGEALRAIADVPIPAAYPALHLAAERLLQADAPGWLTHPPSYNRVLRSLQAEGTPEAARLLAKLAGTTDLGEEFQLLALKTLEHFIKPPPVDFTSGLWRPLPPRDPAAIRAAVAEPIIKLLDQAKDQVMAAALPVSLSLGISNEPEKLAAWVADDQQPEALRLAALAQLDPARASDFTQHQSPAIRAAASKQVANAHPDKSSDLANYLIHAQTATDLLAAYEILSKADGTAAVAILENELDRLSQGEIPEALRLDLIEAAGQRKEASIVGKIASYEKSLSAKGESLLDLTLNGGDPNNGKQVFANQGLCLKCHKAEGQGGIAGPDLDGLTTRLSPAKILESLANPNAEIADGYGITILTLTDGTTLAGTTSEETPTQIKVTTAEGAIQQVSRQTIKTQSPAVSPMPPMALTLTKRDLRDLIAYLKSLDTLAPSFK